MAFLNQVLTLYGWYVATGMVFGFLLALGLWLRWSLMRRWKSRLGCRRGHSHLAP